MRSSGRLSARKVVSMELNELLRLKERGSRPLKVVHCGSTAKALEAFASWRLQDTLDGLIVLTIGADKHDTDLQIGPEQAVNLDILHLWKIEDADYVRILNVGGYIGESTRRELEYALRLKKMVLFVEPDAPIVLPGISCSVCSQDRIELHPCAYCGTLVCAKDSYSTDKWDLQHVGIPLGTWMCVECGCK